MPRIITKRSKPLTPQQERDRAKRYKVTRTGVWIDPFPEIPGTRPEKIVYAALVRRGIPFQFQEWFQVDRSLGLQSADWLRPDFTVPGAKLIIAVQGDYFHTQPAQIEKDSLQFAIYQLMGWTVLPWWEYDIEQHIDNLIDSTPALRALANTGAPLPHVSAWHNDLAGIRTKNRNRRKPWTHKAVKLKVKHRTSLSKTGSTIVKRKAQKGLFQ